MMISLALMLPIVMMALVVVPRASISNAGSMAAPTAVIPAIVLPLSMPTAQLDVPWLLFGSTFVMDAIARPMLFIAAVLYGAVLIAVAWVRGRESTLVAFLLASYLGMVGVFLAADTVGFYLSFAVMSFSAAGLVIHYRTPQAHRATVVYLVMTVVSETALLGGFFLTVGAGGAMLIDAPAAIASSDNVGLIGVLLLIGFGVKAGLVPLHLWLPLAHPAAPPAASAVLSGVMVKAGIFGWLRFLPAADSVSALAYALLILGLLGAFLPVVLGLLQDDPKVILAYSTISQLGFITMVLAAGLLSPELYPATTAAVVLYMVHHGLAKGALFLGVPAVKHQGRGAIGVLTLLGMGWAGLSLAGAPLTSGAFAKYDAKYAVESVRLGSVEVADLLPLVATGSTLLLLRFAWVMWQGERSEPTRSFDGQYGAWLFLCVLGLGLPWLIGTNWLGRSIPEWTFTSVWDMVWPILVGVTAAGPVWWLRVHRRLPTWWPAADGTVIPPGDAVVIMEASVGVVRKAGGAGLDGVHAVMGRVADTWNKAWNGVGVLARDKVEGAETKVRMWTLSGMAGLVFLVVLLLILLFNEGWWL